MQQPPNNPNFCLLYRPTPTSRASATKTTHKTDAHHLRASPRSATAISTIPTITMAATTTTTTTAPFPTTNQNSPECPPAIPSKVPLPPPAMWTLFQLVFIYLMRYANWSPANPSHCDLRTSASGHHIHSPHPPLLSTLSVHIHFSYWPISPPAYSQQRTLAQYRHT
ncbi:hypothetical protein SprV_0501958600 [Sparganum proliferum]